MNTHSDYELPFLDPCPVVVSDTIILPSAELPVRAQSPASLRALEEALKLNRIIFLANRSPSFSTPKHFFKVGTLCRIVKVKSVDINSIEGCVDFIAEGLERASIVRLIKSEDFLSAEVFYDPSPDLVPDGRQLKKLDQKVRKLLEELRPLIPKENDSWLRRAASTFREVVITPHLIQLFNVQNISSPSRLADHTAFRLCLLGLISPKQQRPILNTYRADRRLKMLINVLEDAKARHAALQVYRGKRFGKRQGQRGADKSKRETNRHPASAYNQIKVIDALIKAHSLSDADKEKAFNSTRVLAQHAGISPRTIERSGKQGHWNLEDLKALTLVDLKRQSAALKKKLLF